MRVDPTALAALQTRLLSLMRGPDDARAQSFEVDTPAPAQQQPAATATGAALPPASLAMLVAASAAPLSRKGRTWIGLAEEREKTGLAGSPKAATIRPSASTSAASTR